MDLKTDVGVLKIEGYTGTIKLQRILNVDVLTMSSGTITKHDTWLDTGALLHLGIRQTDGSAIFGASSWTGGNIGGGSSGFIFRNSGSATHPLTFNVGSATSTPTFAGAQWFINARNRTEVVVNWDHGNINIAPLLPKGVNNMILNTGTFVARSTGKISTNNKATKWLFTNRGDVVLRGDKQFEYCIFESKKGSATYKRAALDGTPGTFTVVGDFVHEDGIVQIESGTLAVAMIDATDGGDYTLSGGTVTAVSDSTLDVTGSLAQTGGTIDLGGGTITATGGLLIGDGATLLGYGTINADVQSGGTIDVGGTISVGGSMLLTGGTLSAVYGDITVTGNFTQDGGATELIYGFLDAGGTLALNGGTLSMDGGTLSAVGGVQIASSAALSGSGSILADVTNAGTITVGDQIIFTAVLSIEGDYTQTSTGVLNMDAYSPAPGDFDLLSITGTATLDGTLNFSLLGSFPPSMGDVFSLLNFSSRSGTFATLNLPTLSSGTWDPRYDDPLDTFSLWVV